MKLEETGGLENVPPEADVELTWEAFPSFGSVIRGLAELGWRCASDLPADWQQQVLGSRGVGPTRLAKFQEALRVRRTEPAPPPVEAHVGLRDRDGLLPDRSKPTVPTAIIDFPVRFDPARFEWETATAAIPLHWTCVVPQGLLTPEAEAGAREVMQLPPSLPQFRWLMQTAIESLAPKRGRRDLLERLALLGFSFAPHGAVAEETDPILSLDALLRTVGAWTIHLPESSPERNLAIFLRRLRPTETPTLDQIGQEYGLTRERVRQICERIRPRVLRQGFIALSALARRLLAPLRQAGGLGTVRGLAPAEFSEEEVATVVVLLGMTHPALALDARSGLVGCRGRPDLEALLAAAVDRAAAAARQEASLTAVRVEQIVLDFVRERGLTPAVAHPLIAHVQQVALRDAGGGRWLPQRFNRMETFATLFKREFPHGLDVYRSAAALMAAATRHLGGVVRNSRAMTARLLDSPDILLWGNGFYVHRDHVHPDRSALGPVASWIADRLADGVDAVHVQGAYARFSEVLGAAGVPTPQALYTLLRELQDPRMRLPRYPDVSRPAAGDEAESVADAVESFVRDAGGCASLAAIRTEFLDKRSWPSYRLDQAVAKSRLIPWGRETYRLVDALALSSDQMAALTELCDFLDDRVQETGMVSVRLLPHARPEAWRRADIPSPRGVWEILRRLFSGRLSFVPPVSVLPAQAEPTAWTEAVVAWIRAANGPAPRLDLLAEFRDRRGYHEKNLDGILYRTDALVRTESGSYAHLDNLDWTDEKQGCLISAVDEAIAVATTRRLPFAIAHRIAEVGMLPALPPPFRWTGDLVASIALRSQRHLQLGGCLMRADNEEGILELADLIALILQRRFNGRCPEADLLPVLRELHVVMGGRIPVTALHPPSPLEIVAGEVRLTSSGLGWLRGVEGSAAR